jgi:putative tryptophan/tyrosine transport system permease protein
MILLIIEQSLMALPLLIGAYITLSLLKLPDFTIEGAYLFGAVTAFLTQSCSIPVILSTAFLGGLLIGSLVCTFHLYFKLPFLLAAIVTNGLLHGATQYLLGTSTVSFHPHCGISEISLLSAVGFVSTAIIGWICRSQLGYCFAIYGNNPLFFQNHRISRSYVMFTGVIIAHGCAGISGFLFAKSNGFVDLTMNFGVILLCLTALILGKLFIRSPRPHILIPLIGIVGYFLMQQLLLRLGLNLKYFNATQALFILTVLLVGHKQQTITLNHLGV